MTSHGFDPDDEKDDITEQFERDRLEHVEQKKYWPVHIDRAAQELWMSDGKLALGETSDTMDMGGTINDTNFGSATGKLYAEGLLSTVEGESITEDLEKYTYGRKPKQLGNLIYSLNGLQSDFQKQEDTHTKVKEAFTTLLEKIYYLEGESETEPPNLSEGSVREIAYQIFMDPSGSDHLETLYERTKSKNDFTSIAQEPRMTTQLWEHQKDAISTWYENDCRGYVDMATATGKTVLGLAAIALRHGSLHPQDMGEEKGIVESPEEGQKRTSGAEILVLGGDNRLLLQQWRDEFDEHLNIPEPETETTRGEAKEVVKLEWGRVDFLTPRSFDPESDTIDDYSYDLVIIDEVHSYRGRWRTILEDLVEESDDILAMSGSIDGGGEWENSSVKRVIEGNLSECKSYSLNEAKRDGIIPDFDWNFHYTEPEPNSKYETLKETTEKSLRAYDPRDGVFKYENFLDVNQNEVRTHFSSLSELDGYLNQTKEGSRLTNMSEELDNVAGALGYRQIAWMDMSPRVDKIVDLVEESHPKKCMVLAESVEQVNEVYEMLTEREVVDDERLWAVRSSDPEEYDEKIVPFKDADSGVLVGAGDLLGVGMDVEDLEVGINVPRAGIKQRVTVSIIQRMGRVLRNAGDDATFHHLGAVPTEDEALMTSEDGADLIEKAYDYRKYGEDIKTPPRFTASTSEVEQKVAELEGSSVDEVISSSEDDSDKENLIELKNRRRELGDDESAILDLWGGMSTEEPESSEEEETDQTEDELGGDLFDDDDISLLDLLDNEDPEVRSKAANTLLTVSEYETERVVGNIPYLIDYLGDEEINEEIANCVSNIVEENPSRLLDELEELLEYTDNSVVRQDILVVGLEGLEENEYEKAAKRLVETDPSLVIDSVTEKFGSD